MILPSSFSRKIRHLLPVYCLLMMPLHADQPAKEPEEHFVAPPGPVGTEPEPQSDTFPESHGFKPENENNTLESPSRKQKRYSLRDMPYPELKEATHKAIAEKNFDKALRYFERLLPLCTDLTDRHDIMLEYADILAKNDNNLEKAGKMYSEFAKLYPGSAKVEYAQFKAIECNFRIIADADRDQTQTKITIELADAFMEHADIFTTYLNDVKQILHKCHMRLFESDLNVFTFYDLRGHLNSASHRLAMMRDTHIKHLPDVEPQILNLEIQLADKQKKNDVVLAKKQELTEKFPLFAQTTSLGTKSSKSLLAANRF